MEAENLKDLFEKGIDIISSPKEYAHIVNMKNNLYRLDTINRILLYVQNDNAFDVRTALEWSSLNRDIRKGQKPAYMILPSYDVKYIDNETGETIKDSDLSPDELVRAIEYGIVKRDESIQDTEVIPYFDIRQTKSVNNAEYKVDKPSKSSKELLRILCEITGYSIEESEMDYISNSEKAIYISKKAYNELVLTFAEFIIKYYKYKLAENGIVDTSNFSEYEMELLETTLKYSIVTLFGQDIQCSFDIVRYTNKEKIMEILNISNSIIIDIASHMRIGDTSNTNIDAYHSMNITRKAEVLLNIMEANKINKKMKGE